MIFTVTANPAIDRVYFVDKFEMGEVHRPKKMTYSAGGKGLNVSRVSNILGVKSYVSGFLGGYNGQFIMAEVKKMGLTPCFTEVNGETRICVNISDAQGLSGEILEPGPTIQLEDEKRFIENFEKYVGNADIVTISGSAPKGTSDFFYNQLVEIARKHNKKTIVDTSGKMFVNVLLSKPFMVKPNRYELSVWLGHEINSIEDVKDALLKLKEDGVEVPLCTLGKDGALAYIDGKFLHYVSPVLTVVNSVGSGDSSIAGIASGLSMGLSIKEAIKLGMASGAANTQFEQTGFVTKELVDKYLELTKIEEI